MQVDRADGRRILLDPCDGSAVLNFRGERGRKCLRQLIVAATNLVPDPRAGTERRIAEQLQHRHPRQVVSHAKHVQEPLRGALRKTKIGDRLLELAEILRWPVGRGRVAQLTEVREQIFGKAPAQSGFAFLVGELKRYLRDVGRHALSNGFGFGGVNASVVFRRWTP